MFFALRIIPVSESCRIEIIGEFAERKHAENLSQSAKQIDPFMEHEYIVSTDPDTLIKETLQEWSIDADRPQEASQLVIGLTKKSPDSDVNS